MGIIARILRQNVQTVDAHWQSVSSEAKELIAKLLVKNPAQRITVEHAMEHEWFEPIREHKRLSDQQKATTKKGDEAKADEGMEAQHRGASVKDIKVYNENALEGDDEDDDDDDEDDDESEDDGSNP